MNILNEKMLFLKGITVQLSISISILGSKSPFFMRKNHLFLLGLFFDKCFSIFYVDDRLIYNLKYEQTKLTLIKFNKAFLFRFNIERGMWYKNVTRRKMKNFFFKNHKFTLNINIIGINEYYK